MTQGAISINILSNVREAVRGVDDVADAVADVADSLGDLAKEGDSATDRMQQDFRDLSKSADRESDKLRDKFRDAYRDVRKSSDDTADVVVRNQSRMGERSSEVGQEIRQNLGEGIANAARGDFAALSDTIGDTFGGAVAGIGGIGAAGIAAAGALGVGAVVAAIQLAQQEQEKLNEEAGKWAEAYENSAGRIVSTAHIVADVLAQSQDAERFKEAKDAAADWGVDVPTAMRAIAGEGTALAIVQETLKARTEEATRMLSEQETAVNTNAGATYDLADAVTEGQSRLDRLNEAMALGREMAIAGAQGLYDYATATGTATGETDDLGNKIIALPDGKEIVIDAQTQTAYEDLDAFERRKLQEKTSTIRVQVDDTAWRRWTPVVKNGRIEAYATQGGRTLM